MKKNRRPSPGWLLWWQQAEEAQQRRSTTWTQVGDE